MTTEKDSLFGPTTAELAQLQVELRTALDARWQLARLELGAAALDVRRLAAALAAAGLLGMISLPVLVVALADLLDGLAGLSRTAWLFVEFGALVLAAAGIAWFAYRRFQRQFTGLEETLEVLREDQAWLESLLAERKKRAS